MNQSFKNIPLIDRIQLELGAQEPWPKDVKLYQPYEVEQILLPDNANCLAVQAFLKMCDLDFKIESRANAEAMSPSGKVPFIKCGAFVISELEGIVQFVNNKGISLTTSLEAEQKADMRAYMSLVHNVLENAELYICWCDKETYNEVTKPRNGSVYPWPLNHIQTWGKRSSVIRHLKVMGWYQKSLEEVYHEVENCCQALTDRLEEKEYFFGNNMCQIDALIYGHFVALLTTNVPAGNNSLAFRLERFEILVEYCKKIDKEIMGRDTDFTVKTYHPQSPVEHFDNRIEIDKFKEMVNDITAADLSTSEPADMDTIASDIESLTSDIITEDLISNDSGDDPPAEIAIENSLPTELDALVFGHLFSILTTPLPNSHVANTVRNFPALINVIQRVEKTYFKRETKH